MTGIDTVDLFRKLGNNALVSRYVIMSREDVKLYAESHGIDEVGGTYKIEGASIRVAGENSAQVTASSFDGTCEAIHAIQDFATKSKGRKLTLVKG